MLAPQARRGQAVSHGGNNTSQAFGPSWDSQGTSGSSLVWLVPFHTRQQTDEKGRVSRDSHPLHWVGTSTLRTRC